MLHLVSEKHWMALLLGWMNQYDRPTVQVEAMLSLTTITDLCQQQFYQGPGPAAGVELSPFSTGLDNSSKPNNSKQHVRKPIVIPIPIGSSQPQSQSQSQSNTITITKTNTNTNTKTTTNFGNLVKVKFGEKNAFNLKASAVNNILSKAISQSTGNIASPDSNLKKNSYLQRSGIVKKDGERNDELDDVEEVGVSDDDDYDDDDYDDDDDAVNNDDDAHANDNSDDSNDEEVESMFGKPFQLNSKRPAGNVLSRDIRKKEEIRAVDPPALSPAMLSALNSSFQNLPPMPSNVGLSQSQIPLVGNYTQPLSVTSNNLLVRHPEAIPSFISLMTSPDKNVCENAMWVVGNIAAGEGTGVPGTSSSTSTAPNLGDMSDKSPNVTVKDIVLAAGAMGPLIRCMERFADSSSLQRIGSWVISTLVETKVSPGKKNNAGNENARTEEFDLEQLLNTLRRLLNIDDDDILSYSCWSLSHLCDGPASNIAAVVTSPDPTDPPGGLVPRLVELLHHGNWRVTKPSLRAIGNIVCAEYDEDSSALDDKPLLTDFTEVILECNAVPKLKSLINHCNREIQKEACWTLSNIAAGTVDQIQAVIDSEAIPLLVKLVNNESTDQEVRSEACWVVLNATSCGSDQQIGVLVSEGCVSVLGLLLEETNMVTMALEGLERVLQVEETREAAWRDNQKRIGTDKSNPPPDPLVSASLIQKALNKKHKTLVIKRAQKIWSDHFLSCALCNQPYSKHRVSDAKFCEECKCHVCHKCNCEVYHLSYQEELWATPEEKKGGKSKKSSKKKKKKDKRKEKNKQKAQEVAKDSKSKEDLSYAAEKEDKSREEGAYDADRFIIVPSPTSSMANHDGNESKDDKLTRMQNLPAIDFNLYLQETKSIIAVSRLMDALDQLQELHISKNT